MDFAELVKAFDKKSEANFVASLNRDTVAEIPLAVVLVPDRNANPLGRGNRVGLPEVLLALAADELVADEAKELVRVLRTALISLHCDGSFRVVVDT
jgi:hypothetical protein